MVFSLPNAWAQSSTLNRWENGRATPSPLAMQKIEQYAQQLGERGREVLEQFAK